jgi:hypothetical protein
MGSPESYPAPETCEYCGSPVIFGSNALIYGKEYGNGRCYKCTGCDAYVGVHTGTRIPLGRLATKELRELKKRAHSLFDPLWKAGGLSRGAAYSKLAIDLGIPASECHFGWFDKPTLGRAIRILEGERGNT